MCPAEALSPLSLLTSSLTLTLCLRRESGAACTLVSTVLRLLGGRREGARWGTRCLEPLVPMLGWTVLQVWGIASVAASAYIHTTLSRTSKHGVFQATPAMFGASGGGGGGEFMQAQQQGLVLAGCP
jgi:hypothetical protein